MAIYSTTNRVTGLSGIDVDTMVGSLMKAESMKLNKLKAVNTLTSWKTDSYRSVSKSLLAFQNTFLSFSNTATNMRAAASYANLAATAKLNNSDTNIATVTATAAAKPGTHKLQVYETAEKDAYKSTNTISKNIQSGDVNISALLESVKNDSFTIRVSLDGAASKDINLSKDEIAAIQLSGDIDNKFIQELNNKLLTVYGNEGNVANNPKVKIEYDNNKMTFITTSGHTLAVSEGTVRKSAVTAPESVFYEGFSTSSDSVIELFTINVGGESKTISVAKGNYTDATLAAAINNAIADTKNDAKNLSGSLSASIKDGVLTLTAKNSRDNVEITGANTGMLGGMTDGPLLHTGVMVDLGLDASNSNKITTSKTLAVLFSDINFTDITDDQGNTFSGLKFEINGTTFTFAATDSLQKVINGINSSTAGVNISYNSNEDIFSIQSVNTGYNNGIKSINDLNGGNLMSILGISDGSSRQMISPARDASFSFDGIVSTRESNSFTIEGYAITLNSAMASTGIDQDGNRTYDDIVITSKADSQKTVDLVKKFIEAYNTLIDGMNTLTKTARPKNGTYTYYEPLTSEERSGMSDRDIELWEEKAKTGLLYNDPIVRDIVSSMRSYLYKPVDVGSGSLSLYQIGITTSDNYKEQGKLVIDPEKLLKAIEENPDGVTKLFTKPADDTATTKTAKLNSEGLADRLNDIINGAVLTNGTLSVKAGIPGNVLSESTSELFLLMKNQTTRINTLLDSLVTKENYYYTMFSKMEAAITKNNSTMAYLQSVMGGS